VLCVTALSENPRAARQAAYDVIQSIRFDGMQYRTDIGHRAVKQSTDGKAVK
jgi:phosphoribosylamine--glycine ligase